MNTTTLSKNNQTYNLLSMAFSFFKNHQNPKKSSQIYWVIEENLSNSELITVNYFDEQNQFVASEKINVKGGQIDEDLINRLNQTKKQFKSNLN